VKPADVADLILWLTDERAKNVTGTTIPIDGSTG
jgi:NAD(P)-dependent dehydrogenase (short-subunit alcohol dehydrogenase family)